ncbi:AraC family transcriptional regulator [Paraburkholderia sp. JHI2823]|uniref:helix-turn-helix transcriptional regulator n=1 Tax=Paraburkholderia sp. JHI2823 TaxID=3112960 RepID=UPI0031759993
MRLLPPQAAATSQICYWLLRGQKGPEIAKLASSGSASHGVLRAMEKLRAQFSQPVRVEDLAEIAQLSPSAFHRQFKALTGLPPLQYQKQLRLLEARRLLLSQSMSVQAASFEVGYESPSQFSREYARMFGAPSKRDKEESTNAKTMRDAA